MDNQCDAILAELCIKRGEMYWIKKEVTIQVHFKNSNP